MKQLISACAVVAAALCTAVRADVTVTQQTSMDVASLVHTHGATTDTYTADKKRHDSETHCEGFMAMICGNVQSGEIVRLDRGVTWNLEPKKKMYREEPFATPEQIAAVKAQLNARLEKMKSCPAAQKQDTAEKPKCQMSPPRFDVHKTGEKATLAGFAAERTIGTITESCTNPDTGEVCDTVVALDSWLTEESLPGTSERHAFDLAYAKKLGMDQMMQSMFSGQMAAYMARYQGQFSELAEKAKQFKGQPLKTSFRVLSGGAKCNTKSDASTPSANSDPGASNPLAASPVGQIMGGLFNRRRQPDAPAPGNAGGSAAPAGADPAFPQMAQLVAFTTETTAIKTDPAPAQTFEIPAGWTKETPHDAKSASDDFQCPKT